MTARPRRAPISTILRGSEAVQHPPYEQPAPAFFARWSRKWMRPSDATRAKAWTCRRCGRRGQARRLGSGRAPAPRRARALPHAQRSPPQEHPLRARRQARHPGLGIVLPRPARRRAARHGAFAGGQAAARGQALLLTPGDQGDRAPRQGRDVRHARLGGLPRPDLRSPGCGRGRSRGSKAGPVSLGARPCR